MDPDSNPDLNPNPESDLELITDPDPNLQIISDPAGSGFTTLVRSSGIITLSARGPSDSLRRSPPQMRP
jgi:hypothetical protein